MERNENGYSNFNTGMADGVADSEMKKRKSMQDGCRGNGNIDRGGVIAENNNGMTYSCDTRQLAMVYSPDQCWRMLYSNDEALNHGTLFEELYKPLEEC